MLATFCLRLACGMATALLLLPANVVNPRFYRVQFLTVLGLTALASAGVSEAGVWWLWLALALSASTAFAGSVVWSLDGAPGGAVTEWMGALTTTAALLAVSAAMPPPAPNTQDVTRIEEPVGLPLRLADEFASAAVLGSATTAMLMGHSYLIAPSMSLTPLLRLVAALMIATLLRMGLAGVGLWSFTAGHPFDTLDETALWLPVRWGIGFLAPLVLGVMAWQTTRIRSTQSATGILYVVVIFCFLGELTSQLLLRNTGFVL
jgi:phosphatidylglycerophosphate synthase